MANKIRSVVFETRAAVPEVSIQRKGGEKHEDDLSAKETSEIQSTRLS